MENVLVDGSYVSLSPILVRKRSVVLADKLSMFVLDAIRIEIRADVNVHL
jgi:hypothetical protein